MGTHYHTIIMHLMWRYIGRVISIITENSLSRQSLTKMKCPARLNCSVYILVIFTRAIIDRLQLQLGFNVMSCQYCLISQEGYDLGIYICHSLTHIKILSDIR